MRQTLEFHEESVGGQALAAGPFWALVNKIFIKIIKNQRNIIENH